VARVLNFAHGTLLAIAGVAASGRSYLEHHPVLIAAILFPIFFGFGWLMYVTCSSRSRRAIRPDRIGTCW
jgi:branched-subunit amino acid ABC-type transport system permease component